MQLSSISISSFKNLTEVSITPHDRLNVITGPNGSGKTSLLDAIHVLSMTKSHFGLLDKELVQQGQDYYRIQGQFTGDDHKDQVVAKYALHQRKTIEKNNAPYARLSEHIGAFPSVLIAPDDIQVVTGSSDQRRKWIDTVIAQTDHDYLQQLITYQSQLKQRNALLKQYQETKRLDDQLLTIYNKQLSLAANEIYHARKAFLSDFTPVFQSLYQAIAQNPSEVAEIHYESVLHDASLIDLFAESLSRDKATGRTAKGIHRDDLNFRLKDMPIRKLGSQGQRKSFIIALKLAEAQYIMDTTQLQPILLLDDIFDKIDHQRASHLLNLILKTPAYGQIFLSDTESDRIIGILADIMPDTDYLQYEVAQGQFAQR